MRQIYVDEEIRIRFPQRGTEFDDGVEIGILVLMMTQGETVIERWVSSSCFPQVQALAPQFSYRVTAGGESPDGKVLLTLTSSRVRPRLRIVS